MRISTRGRYALRAMADLALHSTGDCIRTRDIAKRQNISEKYLEQIVTILSKSGLIRSTRGAQGGYRLARKPSEYTIGEILRVAEGDLNPVPEDEAEENTVIAQCEKDLIYKRLYESINMVVDGITLDDIMKEYHERIEALNYII